jgi:D-beta-D-heptose 7-phosphate kinase/D-beta-D-heptose 1-phosphate adenosyltransferase
VGGISNAIKAKGNPIALVNGCFDLIHVEHLYFLQQAKQFIAPHGQLLVLLNSDESIKKLKGDSRPIQPELHRAFILSCLEFVDYVAVFHEPRVTKYLEEFKPTHWVKGPDYNMTNIESGELICAKENNINIMFTERWPEEDRVTTTELINRILRTQD